MNYPISSDTSKHFPQTFLFALFLVANCLVWGATATSPFRWYYHNEKTNETSKAFQAAIENHCGMVVYVGKPGCDVCAGVWSSSMMDGEGMMEAFLKTNQLVGLHVDDDANHYMNLASGALNYKNADGSKVKNAAPFIVFIKVKEDHTGTTSISFSGSKKDIEVFFGGSNGTNVPKMNYANVSKWLTNLMKTAEYKKACPGPNGGGDGDDDSGDDDDDDDDNGGGTGTPLVNVEDFRWYYHSVNGKTTVNETQAAFAAATKYHCGILVYVGKPGCDVCAGVWSSSMMDGEGKMEQFLQDNYLVGLHVDDDANHYMNLASGALNYKNADGSKVKNAAPFLVFIKVKDDHTTSTSISFSGSKSDIDVFFGGSNGTNVPTMNYANVSKWLLRLMDTDEYQEACPGPDTDQTPALEKPNPLAFLEKDPAALNDSDDMEYYDTANGVKRVDTSLTSKVTERYFRFAAKPGRRYIFSVTANKAEGSLALEKLQAVTSNITCAVYTISENGAPSEVPVYAKTTKGFAVLDEGFFFLPPENSIRAAASDEETYYYLKVAADKVTTDLPFALRYSYTEIEEEGSLGMPLWSGAEPGKWTMDYDEILKWSAENGKPFLAYFAALAWCPHCNSLEHLILDTEAFQKATADIPMVVIDNRRRGETTGPTLLYAEDYQAYIQKMDMTITAENLRAKMDEKLAANQEIQKALLAIGGTRIGYPTFLVCQAYQEQNKNTAALETKVRVYARTNDLWNYAMGTDFEKFASNFVNKLTSLTQDVYEETDNVAQNSTLAEVIYLRKEADDVVKAKLSKDTWTTPNLTDSVSVNAWIGGYDTEDWRALEFDNKVSCQFTLEGDFADDAVVTIGIYNTVGEGRLMQAASGTGSDLPSLEFRASGASSYRVKVEVSGQNLPVEYTLKVEGKDLPPYDVKLDTPVYYVRKTDGKATVTATWERKEENSTEAAAATLALDGTGSLKEATQAFGAADGGQISWHITGLTVDTKAVDPVETTVTLTGENARVNGVSTAVIKTFALPAFAEYANGSKLAMKLIQNLPVFDEGLVVVNGLSDTTNFTLSGTLPDGLNLDLVQESNGLAKLVLTGKPTEEITEAQSVSVQLKNGDGTLGAAITLDFTVQSLEALNPVAAKTDNYTGYINSAEDGTVFGTFSVTRQASGSLAVVASLIDLEETVEGIAEDGWTALPTGEVYAEFNLSGELLVLMISTNGGGYGWFEDNEMEDCDLSFLPNMEADVAKTEYAGNYNVSLESSHSDYQGFGWLQVTVDEAGAVTYTGTLPDGAKIAAHKTNLVEESGYGVFTVVAFDGTDFVSGRVQIKKKSVRQDGETSVSACLNSLALFWFDFDTLTTSRLTPCGASYDTAKTYQEQLKGSSEYTTLYLYVASVPYAETHPEESYPAELCPQLLPAGILLTANGDREFQMATSDDETLRPYSGLTIDIQFDETGLLTTSTFQVFDAQENTWVKREFQGILVPVPASCCSAGPDALGYGTLYANDGTSSWPVRITAFVEKPEIATPQVGKVTASGVTVVGKAESNLYTYALLDGDNTIVSVSDDGVFAWRGLENLSDFKVAIVANGFVGEGVPLIETADGGFTIDLAESDVITDEADEETTVKGWRTYGMPTEYVLLDKAPVADDLLVMAYLENAALPVPVTDWTQLEPGQAFWVYLNRSKANGDTGDKLLELPDAQVVSIDYEQPVVQGNYQFWTFPAEASDLECWKWNGATFQKTENPSGGVGWLKSVSGE